MKFNNYSTLCIYWFTEGIDQKTIFTTYFVPIQIVAYFDDGTEETVYVNHSANSPYGVCPLRLA